MAQRQDTTADEPQLNVTDALSYLDSVKTQFSDRPDVYKLFTDIMKDFENQLCVAFLCRVLSSAVLTELQH